MALSEAAVVTNPPDMVRVVVTDDRQRKRATVFFRIILALPHLIVLSAFSLVVVLLAPIVWVIALLRGSVPDGLHDFNARVVRYSTHVYAYLYFATEPWPPFLGEGGYAVDVVLPGPVRQNRWTIFFRGILALPALLLTTVLGLGGVSAVSFYYSIGALAVVGVLAWFACLARACMPRGMRDLAVYALGYAAQTYAYLLLVTPRYPNADPALSEPAPLPEHPIGLDLREDDLTRHRLLVLFRGLLAIPHLVWLTLWGLVALLAAILGWLAALATGQVPGPLHRFLAALVRYQAHVYGFLFLVAEPFPGFTGTPGTNPVALTVGPAEPQRRLTVLFRPLLAFPALLLGSALSGAQSVSAVMGWFVALFTGRMPRGLRNLNAYAVRYNAQVTAYAMLVTPHYPFSGPGRCDR